jgi:DNA repair protein RecO (recombination protein O)
MHTLLLELDERTPNRLVLREARIDRARLNLTSSLAALTSAGRALGWVRRAAPERVNEPEIWAILSELLDSLDEAPNGHSGVTLASAGLQLLIAFGWGIEFERCVRCGLACPAERTAMIDPARGGLVCSSCGGAAVRVGAAARARLVAASGAQPGALLPEDTSLALRIVDAALTAHAGSA